LVVSLLSEEQGNDDVFSVQSKERWTGSEKKKP
jgi:hypothetical protein